MSTDCFDADFCVRGLGDLVELHHGLVAAALRGEQPALNIHESWCFVVC